MKQYVFLLITLLFVAFLGCASPDGGPVALDGPILESVNRQGALEFNGAVVNTGDDPVESVHVVIVLKDEKGSVVEANSASVLGDSGRLLYPSERAFFRVTIDADPQRVFSKEVEIYTEKFSNLPPSS